jgi:hypothetical protein
MVQSKAQFNTLLTSLTAKRSDCALSAMGMAVAVITTNIKREKTVP